MSGYSLIAFDMDGTLLNSKKQISPRTRAAIEKAAEAGKNVALCTGRCLPELYDTFDKLPCVRYAVCVSGAMIYDTFEKKILYSDDITPAQVLRIIDAIDDRDVFLHILTDRSIVETAKVPLMARYGMGIYTSMFAAVTDKKDDLKAFYRADPFPAAKVNIYHTSTAERQLTYDILSSEGLAMAFAENYSLECSAPGVNKGKGLIRLCDLLGISPADAIAVGDADNDIQAISAAGLGVAMGNANAAVKAAARYICADNDHDGCAEVIDRFLL